MAEGIIAVKSQQPVRTLGSLGPTGPIPEAEKRLSGAQRNKARVQRLEAEKAELIRFCAYLINRLEDRGKNTWQTKK